MTNKIGPRLNLSDGCRARMEKIIGEDETDERAKKTKERFDHYAAQQVAEGDENRVSAEDLRPDAQNMFPHLNFVMMEKAVARSPRSSTLAVP